MTVALTMAFQAACADPPVRSPDAFGPELAGNDRSEAAREFLARGMMHMTGQSVPVDLVAAHKWFNLAAQHGDEVAVRLRREIAAEMSPSEIAAAQRAARSWRGEQ
jgi:TPR repeat protein